MRTPLRAVVGLVCVAFSFGDAALAADPPVKSADAAATLVRAALEAELSDNAQERSQLLHNALRAAPDYAPARWQLGQVKLKDAWLKADEVPGHAGEDTNYNAYLKRRDVLVDTADEHRAMARWCQSHRLPAEAKLHWGKVFGFEREDAEALDALGLQSYEGRLLTREQIEEAKIESRERKLALGTWRPRMLKLRQALEGKDDAKRTLAQGELSRLNDPHSLAALENVFSTEQSGERADRANLALIGVAERIPQPEATEILLRQAMNSQSEPVVRAACAALKKRPLHTFVPQLIAAMPNAVKSQFGVYLMPNGTVAHEHAVEIENSAGVKQLFTYESIVHPTDLAVAQSVTPRAVATELNKVARIEAAAAAMEEPNRRRRQRLQRILEETTGFEDVTDPELIAQQFAEHYGWSKPERATETLHQHASEFAGIFPIPSQQPKRPTRNIPSFQPPVNGTRNRGLARAHGECFAAGTPVMTTSGPRAIELLRAGDRVLAQDAKSGALEFKTVQDRTLRLGAKVLKLKIGNETLTSTYGHPFWVVGTGWKVAGHLQVGDRLRGLEKDYVVEVIEEARPTEVYNLLVTDHATFFVGSQRLLVHDDSQVLETGRAVPGLVATASAPGN